MPGKVYSAKELDAITLQARLVVAVQELGRAQGLLSEILGDPEDEQSPPPSTLFVLADVCQNQATLLADRAAKLRDKLGSSL